MRAALNAARDLHLNRRSFLRASAAAAGGLLVSLYVDFPALAQGGNQAPPAKVFPPDAFIHIRSDGRIVIMVNRLEFGHGVHTSLPMILADEMDADWSQVAAELAPAADVYRDPIFGLQMTGGSASIANSFQQYRELGAKTRAMLVAVVADRFWTAKQARDRLKIEWDLSGVERPDSSELRSRYKELARTAGKVAVSRGDDKAMDRIPAASRIVAEYEFPYLAHACMEPLNTTIRFDGDRAEAWVPSQFPGPEQAVIP